MNRLRSYFLAIKPNIAASSLLAVSLLIGIVVKSIGWLAGQILSKDLLAVMVLAIPLLFLAYKLRKQSGCCTGCFEKGRLCLSSH